MDASLTPATIVSARGRNAKWDLDELENALNNKDRNAGKLYTDSACTIYSNF